MLIRYLSNRHSIGPFRSGHLRLVLSPRCCVSPGSPGRMKQSHPDSPSADCRGYAKGYIQVDLDGVFSQS